MAIYNLYSKRQKQARGETPDVYTYNSFPTPLRIQLIQLIESGIGKPNHDFFMQYYKNYHQVLCREFGVFSLDENRLESDWEAISNTLLNTDSYEQFIDILEVGLHIIDKLVRQRSNNASHSEKLDEIISEVNIRLREHGVGYEYTNGEIIRIDSQLIHKEVVKPALQLLSDSKFKGPNEEFLSAHDHYRNGKYKECLNDCLKAFESTMKTICALNDWEFDSRDTAKTLIEICIRNGLFPAFLQTHVTNLRVILESGVPTIRNKLAGHGQGPVIASVSQETASYVLHVTAANIVFFVNAQEALS